MNEDENTNLMKKRQQDIQNLKERRTYELEEEDKKILTGKVFLAVFLVVFLSMNYSKFTSDSLKNHELKIKQMNIAVANMTSQAKIIANQTAEQNQTDLKTLQSMELRAECLIRTGTNSTGTNFVIDVNSELFAKFDISAVPFYTVSSMTLTSTADELKDPKDNRKTKSKLNMFHTSMDRTNSKNLKFQFSSDFAKYTAKVCFIAEGKPRNTTI